MSVHNCWTVGSRELHPGIELDSIRHVSLRAGKNSCRIVIEQARSRDRPVIQEGRVLNAFPRKRSGKNGLIFTSEKWRGSIVRIRTLDLDFGFGSIFGDVSYRVGGEGTKRMLFAQAGSHRDREKDQVFRLQPTEEMIIVDGYGVVMVLRAKDPKDGYGLDFHPADYPDLERHLKRRIPTLVTDGALAWGRHVLSAIGGGSSDVRRALEQQEQQVLSSRR